MCLGNATRKAGEIQWREDTAIVLGVRVSWKLDRLILSMLLAACAAANSARADLVTWADTSLRLLELSRSHEERSFALELQGGPSTYQYGLTVGSVLLPKDDFDTFVGLNIADNRSVRLHDVETQKTIVVGFGWRHWLDEKRRGFFFGARPDLFLDNEIQWEDHGQGTAGTSKAYTIVPTLQAGWRFGIKTSGFYDLLAVLGREHNFLVNGEDVGQGYIFRVGMVVGANAQFGW